MPKWTKAEGREALATVSSLKRALGIAPHPCKKDTFVGEDLHIYTSDKDSAVLLGELLYRYGNGPREKFYNSRPEISTLRDSVRVDELPDGGYGTSMNINYAPHLKKMLDKMIQKHIAPDKSFTR